MSPRSTDTNAAQTKQKKKADSPPSVPVDTTPVPVASPSITAPATPPTPATLAAPVQAKSVSSVPPAPIKQDASPLLAATSSSNPRVFVASALKPVSTIDTVTNTISALSQHANRGISSLIANHSNIHNATSPLVTASADHSTPLRTDGSVSPIYDAFHNAGNPPDPSRIEAALHHANQQAQIANANLPHVLWSRWDRLALKAHPLKLAPLLISYFDDGTLQALLVQDRNVSELLCLPNAAHALQARDASIFSTKAQLLTAFVRHPTADNTDPQLLIVLQEPDTASRLLVYSLAAHQVQASLELRHTTPSELFATQDRRADLWPQLEAKCNDRYLVLSFAYPPSVHALSTSTLKYIQPPITDVASVASNRPPPISLSHRLLAFACTASDAVSPIRSDVRKMSNAAYHDPSRPYANAQADASGRVGEMRDNLFETSAHVGDAARRIRGGVMSGVRTLGEWGSSYWPNAGSPPATGAFSPPNQSLLSQSAPHNAHSPRPASSVSSSPMLLAADGNRTAKRLSTGATNAVPIKPDTLAQASATSAVHAGSVRVVDLGSEGRTVSTFLPSGHAVVALAFSPCGRMLLTADILGHAFHVFELTVAGTFANAGTFASSTVAHRYKLMRGITTADVVHAEWSHNAQWVTVGTRSGTVHVYAVNPFGGVPIIGNHVEGKVRNPQVLQPFGVSLASLARSIRPSPPLQQDVTVKPAPATGFEAGTAAATTTAANVRSSPPVFMLIGNGVSGSTSEGDVTVPFEILTSDPRTVSVTLHAFRCWTTQARATGASISNEAHPSTSPEIKQRFATATSPRSSGLSQMMRKAGESLLHSQQAPRLQAECLRVALWEQLSPEDGVATKQTIPALSDHAITAQSIERSHDSLSRPLTSVAKAEIETYSQSPAMLPSSIFLSRQTFFHARARNNNLKLSSASAAGEAMRCIQRQGSRPIQVRRTARVVSREPSSEHAKSFDDGLAGAFDQMSFDPDNMPQRSASAHIPSFPQGQRGRSSGWTSGSSIPIRIVAGGLGGIYRAGKELGRGVDMARRRTSGASGTAPPDGSRGFASAATASISFDDDDDVDLLGGDEGSRRHYRGSVGVDLGSARSDASLLSTLRHDGPGRGSQPSSAETPSTRFSEAEDAAADADADECDWDAIEASRSPAVHAVPLFDLPVGAHAQESKTEDLDSIKGGDSLDDDFTVGILDVDEGPGEVTVSHSCASLSASQAPKGLTVASKELVYALPAGGSTRSSLLSQGSSLTTTLEARLEVKDAKSGAQDSGSSTSEGGGSGSQTSAASGLLCEGSKETYTTDDSPAIERVELVASSDNKMSKDLESVVASKPAQIPVISTSGGNKKKKKKGGR